VTTSKAYLSTIITRLALDYLKSARVAREQYIGAWLPEPILTHGGSDQPSGSGCRLLVRWWRQSAGRISSRSTASEPWRVSGVSGWAWRAKISGLWPLR